MYSKLKEEVAKVRGGLSDNMTVEDIAEKHKTSVDAIKLQIEKGQKIEMEHTDDAEEAKKVAMDHLVEIPDYYDRLIKMEKEADRDLNEQLETIILMNFLDEDEKKLNEDFLLSTILLSISGGILGISLLAPAIVSLFKKVTESKMSKFGKLMYKINILNHKVTKNKQKIQKILRSPEIKKLAFKYFIDEIPSFGESYIDYLLFDFFKNNKIDPDDNNLSERKKIKILKFILSNSLEKNIDNIGELLIKAATSISYEKFTYANLTKTVTEVVGNTSGMGLSFSRGGISPTFYGGTITRQRTVELVSKDQSDAISDETEKDINSVIDKLIPDLSNFKVEDLDERLKKIVEKEKKRAEKFLSKNKELNEAMLLLTESEKEIKDEIEKVKRFFVGENIPGFENNRFIKLWNMIRDNFKMEVHHFLKLLNPLNWPKAIFMNFYNIIKSIATLGTRENESLRLETQKFLRDIADGKYKGKPAKEMFADYNEIRKEYGFKPYTFLQEDVIRRDFNGVVNRDFDGNIIDESLEEYLK